jgi:hypothetical protein
MLRKVLQKTCRILIVTTSAFLASCMTAMQAPPTAPTVEVAVAGKAEQLAAFDQALRPLLGTEPVACLVTVNGQPSGCEALQTNPVPPSAKDLTYDFFGPHTWVFEKLGAAFNQVQSQGTLTLTTKPVSLIIPDCSALPQPCVASPWCPQYGNCSKQKYPCAKC